MDSGVVSAQGDGNETFHDVYLLQVCKRDIVQFVPFNKYRGIALLTGYKYCFPKQSSFTLSNALQGRLPLWPLQRSESYLDRYFFPGTFGSS